jgi:hypothetical protein
MRRVKTKVVRDYRVNHENFTFSEGLFDGPTHILGTGLRSFPNVTMAQFKELKNLINNPEAFALKVHDFGSRKQDQEQAFIGELKTIFEKGQLVNKDYLNNLK